MEEFEKDKWYCPICDPCKEFVAPFKIIRKCNDYNKRIENLLNNMQLEHEDKNNLPHAEPLKLDYDLMGISMRILEWTPKMVFDCIGEIFRWAKAGFPLRTDEEIEKIEKICRDCTGDYKVETIQCPVCRCYITSKSKAKIMHKARLATSYCPRLLWGKQ